MIGVGGFDRAGRLLDLAPVTIGITALTLASCSGGGGGGGRSGTPLKSNPDTSYLAAAAEPSLPAVAGDWLGSVEYNNSTGLAQLKAAEGYARRSSGMPGGQGVRIAIIDGGIDVTHPDLGNLADTSWTAGGEALVGDSHATFVAGIAGASRTQSADPNDMHGMAYRATLVNFQASRPSQFGSSGGFGTGDLFDAIRAASGLVANASAVESDILNLSLGAPSDSDSAFAVLRTAMRAAAAEDKIMVIAAGNQGLSGDPDDKLQPIYPAAYVDDSGIAGYAIAVGNLTSTDQAAASSNHCGDTRNYCLFAPGTNIRSTIKDGAYGIGSGTSFSAPYVAGAAAVVKAAFPGVSSRDVVDRLLLTAADLGAAGVDSTYGRGKLDLEAAMAPVGPTGLPIGPTVDGPVVPVITSALRLAPGLHMSSSAKERLQRAMAVDSMGFPFPVDLSKGVETTERGDGLSAFIGDPRRALAAAGAAHARLTAFIPEKTTLHSATALPEVSTGHGAGDDEVVPLSFSADITDAASVFVSLNGGDSAWLGLEAGLAERRATLMSAGELFSPFGGLAGVSSGAGASFSPSEGTTIAVSALASTTEGEGPQAALQRLEVVQAMPGDIEARVGLGLVQEDDSFLGSRASGAFGDDISARSQFLTISLLGPLADDVDWFATYSHGRSSISEVDAALVGDWSDPRSEAFGAGLVIRDLAGDDDGLTLLVGQPFRQEHAQATVRLPVAREPDGTVVTARQRLDFAPKAREITTEIGYRLPLGRHHHHDLRAAGFLRFNPDHDRSRDPEAGIGLAYRLRF